MVDQWLLPVIWCLQFFFLFAFVWWNLRRFLRTRMLASPIWHFTSWRISPWKCFSSPLHPLLEKPWIDGCNEWNRENLWDNQWACKCWSMVRCKSYFRPFWGLGFGKLWRRKWAKGVIAEKRCLWMVVVNEGCQQTYVYYDISCFKFEYEFGNWSKGDITIWSEFGSHLHSLVGFRFCVPNMLCSLL